MKSNADKVRKTLEDKYDIPFSVKEGTRYGDPWFNIKPANGNEEFFEIHIEIKNQIRIVVEISPERYAAFSIKDMSKADEFKKQMFVSYAYQIINKRAKLDFFINDMPQDPLDYRAWPEDWNKYRCRISKSPIFLEDQNVDVTSTVVEWAAIVTGMFLSLLDVIGVQNDSEAPDLMHEGGVKNVTLDRYERNPVNRELCLAANGYRCKICGFDFNAFYGDIGNNFIHVHHIEPISKMKTEYLIDPVKDLIPVCPNCHAMLHRCDPPLKPGELREIIKKQKSVSDTETGRIQKES